MKTALALHWWFSLSTSEAIEVVEKHFGPLKALNLNSKEIVFIYNKEKLTIS